MMQQSNRRFVTVAIHTYEKAVELRSLLESEGIEVMLNNVNLEQPSVSPGIRVRIAESDLPLALRIIENHEVFSTPALEESHDSHYILVPVDFGDFTIETVKVAAKVAEKHKATITLLHSYIDPYIDGSFQLNDSLNYDIIDAEARNQISNAAHNAMSKLMHEVRDGMKSGEIAAVKFKSEIVEGVPEDAIVSYARQYPPLITVMGTRGADKKEKEMIGSVAAEVLDECRFPTMTLPQNLDENYKIKKVIFFCNEDQQDILAMDNLVRLLPGLKAEITMVAIGQQRRWSSRPRRGIDILTDYFSNNYPAFTFKGESIDSRHAIDRVRQLHADSKYDLIVIPNKRKKNILGRIFNPSLAHRIIFSADIPMLVIPV